MLWRTLALGAGSLVMGAPAWAQDTADSGAAPAATAPAATAPAATAPLAPSEPSAADLTFVQSRQTWGWAGLGMVGGGLVLGVTGAVLVVGGVVGVVGGGVEGDAEAVGQGGKSVIGGALIAATGLFSASVGVPLASASSLHGAARAKRAGLPVNTTAGWVSVGALGGYLALGALPDSTVGKGMNQEQVPGRIEGIGRPLLVLTSVGASAGQLVQTRAALRATGYAAAPARSGRPPVQVAVVPAGRGLALTGQF